MFVLLYYVCTFLTSYANKPLGLALFHSLNAVGYKITGYSEIPDLYHNSSVQCRAESTYLLEVVQHT